MHVIPKNFNFELLILIEPKKNFLVENYNFEFFNFPQKSNYM